MSLDLSKIYAASIAAAMLVVAAPAAQAFTIENGDGGATASNLMAPSPFNDPVKKETDRNGGTLTQFGGTSLYVGPAGASVERDYYIGVNRMFSPLGRPPD
jgi:hypothetical protein